MPDRHGKYAYFDTPDGTDGPKKLWYVSKTLAKIAVFTGTWDAFVITNAQTRAGVFAVYARHLGLFVGSGIAFTCATYISTDLRKKDDHMNHIVGSLAASAIVGSALANPWAFASMAAITCPVSYVVKNYEMHGVRVFQKFVTDIQVTKEFPTPYWHIKEIGSKDNSMKKMYEEKNEEFYRNLDKSRESSV